MQVRQCVLRLLICNNIRLVTLLLLWCCCRCSAPDIPACDWFPCAGTALCIDLRPPAGNSTLGRNCSCELGRLYVNDTVGCGES